MCMYRYIWAIWLSDYGRNSWIINDPSLSFKEAVYATIYRGDIQGRTVKTDKWRYTEWDKGSKGIELYDQLNDPDEYQNLAGDNQYQKIIHEMKKYFAE